MEAVVNYFRSEKFIRQSCFFSILFFLVIGVVVSLIELLVKSLHSSSLVENEQGQLRAVESFVGIRNFTEYLQNENLMNSLFNSIKVAGLSSIIAVSFAFIAAYAIQRTQMKAKSLFKLIFMLPIFAPTMYYGLSLIYLFGKQGLVTKGFFGTFEGFDIGLYGMTGIVIAESFYIFPAALIILLVAFSNMDARLYEAAEMLDDSPSKTFFNVTLPGVKYGVMSAIFVTFTLAFTDFGAPKVVGGSYNVLAVDIYKQVLGQNNFYMGATISIILLIPAVLSFFADRYFQGRQSSAMSAKSVKFVPKKNAKKDYAFLAICVFISSLFIIMMGTGLYASMVKMWPYNLSLSFDAYSFEGMGESNGLGAFWNSLRMSAYSAIIGTVITFFTAYLVTKTRGLEWFKKSITFLSLIPLALPGLVIGFSYIFFFNRPEIFGFKNPFGTMYGTMAILVLANVIHFFSVSYMTAKTALQQLDDEFEVVSESMGYGFWTSLRRVTIPVCFPAIIEIAMYFFASSMATVSAVIFLESSNTRPATVAIINMDDAGDQVPALAMCVLIIGVNILAKVFSELTSWYFKRRQVLKGH